MSYPFLTLDDNTEITHSELFPDGSVKVTVEKPVYRDFHSATCILPSYEWRDVRGFTDVELDGFRKMIANGIAPDLIRYYEQLSRSVLVPTGRDIELIRYPVFLLHKSGDSQSGG